MPDRTNYLGLQLWSDGEENWEHRSDFEKLDTRVIDHGPIDDRPEMAPHGALYLATDWNILFQWNNKEGWIERAGSGSNDQALSDQYVGSVQTDNAQIRDNTGEVYAREFNGNSLDEKIDNALTHLDTEYGSHGRVRITPRTDGEPWSWENTLEIRPRAQKGKGGMTDSGVHLDFDNNIIIEYSQNGFAIEYWGYEGGWFAPLRLTGGIWKSVANPDGWLQTHDMTASYIHPCSVFCSNDDNNARCLEIRHYEYWSENNVFSGSYRGDIGIEFKHGEYLDEVPSNHGSFHGTSLTNFFISTFNKAIVIRGNWSYCNGRNIQMWSSGENANLLTLSAYRMDGTTFNTVKFENPGKHDEVTAIALDEEYDGYYGPLFIAPKIGNGIEDTKIDDSWSNANDQVVAIDAFGRAFTVHNLTKGDAIRIEAGNRVRMSGAYIEGLERIESEVLDVLNDIPSWQLTRGMQAYHNGSGENPEGPAFYNGDHWISVVNGSEIN